MIRIALTGNIASGKSVVQKILEEKGYKVLDTDDVAHKLLTVSNKELFEAFKDYDVFENNEFSRVKLGKLIFSNKDLKQKLESIIHPLIRDEIQIFFSENNDKELLFVGIPLLFESKMEDLFDKIIFIYADDNIRLERLLKRNNLSVEDAMARINSQMPQYEKVPLCDYVINNNGTIEELTNKISIVLDRYKYPCT